MGLSGAAMGEFSTFVCHKANIFTFDFRVLNGSMFAF